MTIRNVQEQDYEKLVSLYKEFFPTHDIFQKEDNEIITYLKNVKETFLVDDELKGALILVMIGQNKEGTHKRWKFRHFAFKDEVVGKELLVEAEKRVKENSETCKIELNIAETEPGKEFYLNNGYEQEAALKNHYRQGETCFILGKSI